MLTIKPREIPTGKLHAYLLGAIAPRPICFASTIDADGNPNLSPYSFFNVFGSNPPMMIFSPARRVRDNTTKHTLQNAEVVKEVVINVVNYDIVHQMSLSSTEYPEGVNDDWRARLKEEYSTHVIGGQDHLKGKMFRVGSMGETTVSEMVEGCKRMISCFRDFGIELPEVKVESYFE